MTSKTTDNFGKALKKHQNFLSKFKSFPQKTRKGIWLELLQAPLNHQHFIELTKPFPLLPEHTVNRQVSFITSAFVKLYPDLNIQWLPGLIHPFVILFKNDAIAAFEISLTFLMNWLKPLFNDYPNSSKLVMSFFSSQLPMLEKRVNDLNYPLSSIIHPMLMVSLTDVLNKQNCLEVFDFLAAHPYSPQYFLCIAVKIVAMIQQKLCTLETVEDISITLRKQKNINIQDLISSAIQLGKEKQTQLNQIYANSSFPLSKGRYPICSFIKRKQIIKNDVLDNYEEDKVQKIQKQFNILKELVNNKLKKGIVANSEDIDNRYKQVEGQMRQYLNQIKIQHQNKLKALRQIQQDFKQKLNNQGKIREDQYQRELQAIERRARVEKEIILMQRQANSIREAERDMLKRIQDLAQLKKAEIESQNLKLKNQQRRYQAF